MPSSSLRQTEAWLSRLVSPLFVELRWLDGLTWRVLGITTAIAAMMVSIPVIVGLRYMETYGPLLLVATGYLLEGFAIPIIGVALTNLRRPKLPLPVILI